MHESLRSVRWSWVWFGWFIAVSLTSAVLLTLQAFGIGTAGAPGEALWVAAALVLGFFPAGVFVGTRVAAAPMLHGLTIGLCSLLAWFLINLFFGEPLGASTWRSLELTALVGLLLLQVAAAVVGTRVGVRWVRRGAA